MDKKAAGAMPAELEKGGAEDDFAVYLVVRSIFLLRVWMAQYAPTRQRLDVQFFW